jgi:hypothetical protein
VQAQTVPETGTASVGQSLMFDYATAVVHLQLAIDLPASFWYNGDQAGCLVPLLLRLRSVLKEEKHGNPRT